MSSRPTVAGVSRSVLSRVSTVLPFAGGQAHRDLADRLREVLGPRDRVRPLLAHRSRAGGLLSAPPMRSARIQFSVYPIGGGKSTLPPDCQRPQRNMSIAA